MRRVMIGQIEPSWRPSPEPIDSAALIQAMIMRQEIEAQQQNGLVKVLLLAEKVASMFASFLR